MNGQKHRLNASKTIFYGNREQKNRQNIRMKTAQGQTIRPAPVFLFSLLLIKEEQT